MTNEPQHYAMKPDSTTLDSTQRATLRQWVKAKAHAIAWIHSVRWLRRVTPASPRRFQRSLYPPSGFVDTEGNEVQYATLWYWCWLVTSTWK